jgi:hypothetical protein
MDRIDEINTSVRKLNLLTDTDSPHTRCLMKCLQEMIL